MHAEIVGIRVGITHTSGGNLVNKSFGSMRRKGWYQTNRSEFQDWPF